MKRIIPFIIIAALLFQTSCHFMNEGGQNPETKAPTQAAVASNEQVQNKPVNLFGMNYYHYDESSSVSVHKELSVGESDIHGNHYSSGWRMIHDELYSVGAGFDVYYQLSGKYSKLTGVFTPGDEFETSVGDDIAKYYVVIKIYSDDSIIYTKAIYCNSDPQLIDLDITGTKMLRIKVESTNWDQPEPMRVTDAILANFHVQ